VTPEQFVVWMAGFRTALGESAPSARQWDEIKGRLAEALAVTGGYAYAIEIPAAPAPQPESKGPCPHDMFGQLDRCEACESVKVKIVADLYDEYDKKRKGGVFPRVWPRDSVMFRRPYKFSLDDAEDSAETRPG